MKNLWVLLIVIAGIGIIIGSYFLGRKSVECISTVINPAQTIVLNAGENKRLQEQHSKDSLTIIRLNEKIDSLNKPKKNETKINIVDTCIPTVLRQWADYQANE